MQYIKKTYAEPDRWSTWFVDGNNLRDYDFRSIRYHPDVLLWLINEQNGLCAYCQKEISSDNATIEHIVPYGQNKLISTAYHNLVAVCTNFIKDENKLLHCDKSRGDTLLPPIIFHKDFTCPGGLYYKLFDVETDGTIRLKEYSPKVDWSIYTQLMCFIEILNLNHKNLKELRFNILQEWEKEMESKSAKEIRSYLQFKYTDILDDLTYPFRQFLLIYIEKSLASIN